MGFNRTIKKQPQHIVYWFSTGKSWSFVTRKTLKKKQHEKSSELAQFSLNIPLEIQRFHLDVVAGVSWNFSTQKHSPLASWKIYLHDLFWYKNNEETFHASTICLRLHKT